VLRNFVRTRANRLATQRAHQRLVAAHAYREVGRACATALCVAHERLDDSVLERVERDHREPSTGMQHLERRRQRMLERAELVVDRDAQGLEDALCWMAL